MRTADPELSAPARLGAVHQLSRGTDHDLTERANAIVKQFQRFFAFD